MTSPSGDASTPAAATAASAPPEAPDLRDPDLYINRELSLLRFQGRVLEEARDARNPLLERVKFLGIFGSNMGEFFMVRIAGLKQQVAAGVNELSPDGLTPAQVLELVRAEALRPDEARRAGPVSELLPELDQAGIHIVDYASL